VTMKLSKALSATRNQSTWSSRNFDMCSNTALKREFFAEISANISIVAL